MAIIHTVQRLMDNGDMTQREACNEVNIHHTMHTAWTKQLDVMQQNKNGRSKALCPGRPSCLEPHKDDLLRFIFELREQGLAVSVSMVVVKAAQIAPELRLKSGMAQYHSALSRFVRTHGLVFCLGLTNRNARLLRPPLRHWTTLPM
jgi:hypothetical protein